MSEWISGCRNNERSRKRKRSEPYRAVTWAHKRKGDRVRLAIDPFVKFSKRIRAGIEVKASSLERFLQVPTEVQIKS